MENPIGGFRTSQNALGRCGTGPHIIWIVGRPQIGLVDTQVVAEKVVDLIEETAIVEPADTSGDDSQPPPSLPPWQLHTRTLEER